MLGCIGFLLVVVIMTFIILIIKRIVIANSNNQTTRRYRNIHVNRPSKNRSSKVIPHPNRKPIEPSVRHPSYKEASGNGFLSTFLNKGNYGEYLTYKELTRLKGYHRVMTNLYIPTKSGKSTELDLVMISQKEFSYWNPRIIVDGYLEMREIRIGCKSSQVARSSHSLIQSGKIVVISRR